jgi:hypothetical protein
MNLFSLLIIAGMALWLVKPLRVIVVRRTNLTVKALLIAFPVAYALTLGYRFFWGDRDDSVVVGFTVLALLIAWGILIGIGTVLERHNAVPLKVAPLGPETYIPGMPTRMGELGTARAAEASRAAHSRATAEHATAKATAAIDVALPTAIRALSAASPIAGKIAEIAAPHAVRAAQSVAPAAIQRVQEGAPAALQRVQESVQTTAQHLAGRVSRVDTTSAAVVVGRVAGTWFAKAKKSFAEGAAPTAPR